MAYKTDIKQQLQGTTVSSAAKKASSNTKAPTATEGVGSTNKYMQALYNANGLGASAAPQGSAANFSDYYNQVRENNQANGGLSTSGTLGGFGGVSEEPKEANWADQIAAATSQIASNMMDIGGVQTASQKAQQEQGLSPGTVAAMVPSLVTSTIGAMPSGLSQVYEGLSGHDISNVRETGQVTQLTPEQQMGAFGEGIIDVVSPMIGGEATAGKGLLKTVTTASKLARGAEGVAKDAEKLAAKNAQRAAKGKITRDKNLLDTAAEMDAGGVTTKALKETGVKNPFALAGAQIATDTLEEGGEEFAQSLFDDMRNDTMDDTSLQRAVEAGGWGALGGAMLSGAGSAMGLAMQGVQSTKAYKNLTGQTNAPIDSTNKPFTQYQSGFANPYTSTVRETREARAVKELQPNSFSVTMAPANMELGLDDTIIGDQTFYGMWNALSDNSRQEWAASLNSDVQTISNLVENNDFDNLNNLIENAYQSNNPVVMSCFQDPATGIGTRELSLNLRGLQRDSSACFLNTLAACLVGADVDGDQKRYNFTPYSRLQQSQTGEIRMETNYPTQLFTPNMNDTTETPIQWDYLKTWGSAATVDGSATNTFIKNLVEQTLTRYGITDQDQIDDLSNRLAQGLRENAGLGRSGVVNPQIGETEPGQQTNVLGQAFADIRDAINGHAQQQTGQISYQGNQATSQMINQLLNATQDNTDVWVDIVAHFNEAVNQEAEDLNKITINERLRRTEVGGSWEFQPVTTEEYTEVDDATSKVMHGTVNRAKNLAELVNFMGFIPSLTRASRSSVVFREDSNTYYGTKYIEMLNTYIKELPDTTSYMQLLSQIYRIEMFGEQTKAAVTGLFNIAVQRDVLQKMVDNGQPLITAENPNEQMKDFKELFRESYDLMVDQYNKAFENVQEEAERLDLFRMDHLGKTDKDLAEGFMRSFGDVPISSVFNLTLTDPMYCATFNELAEFVSRRGGYAGEFEFFAGEGDTRAVPKFITSLIRENNSKAHQCESRLNDFYGDIAETVIHTHISDPEVLLNSRHIVAATYKLDSFERTIGGLVAEYASGETVESALNAGWGQLVLTGTKADLQKVAINLSMQYKYRRFLETRERIESDPDMDIDSDAARALLIAGIKEASDGTVLSTFIQQQFEDNNSTAFLDMLCDSSLDITYDEMVATWEQATKEIAGYTEPLLFSAISDGDTELAPSVFSENLVRAKSHLKQAVRNDYDACKKQVDAFWNWFKDSLPKNDTSNDRAVEYFKLLCYQMMNIENDEVLSAMVADQIYKTSEDSQKGQTKDSENLHSQQVQYAFQGQLSSYLELQEITQENSMSAESFASNKLAMMAVLFGGKEIWVHDSRGRYKVDAETIIHSIPGYETANLRQDGTPTIDQIHALMNENPNLITWFAPQEIGDISLDTPVTSFGYNQDFQTQFRDLTENGQFSNDIGSGYSGVAQNMNRISWKLFNSPSYYSMLAGCIDPKIIETGTRKSITNAVKKAHEQLTRYMYDRVYAAQNEAENIQELSGLEISSATDTLINRTVENLRSQLRSTLNTGAMSNGQAAEVQVTLNNAADGLGDIFRANLREYTDQEYHDQIYDLLNNQLPALTNGQDQAIQDFCRSTLQDFYALDRFNNQARNPDLVRSAATTTIVSSAMMGEDYLINSYISALPTVNGRNLTARQHNILAENYRQVLRQTLNQGMLGLTSRINLITGEVLEEGSDVMVDAITASDLIWDYDINQIFDAFRALTQQTGTQADLADAVRRVEDKINFIENRVTLDLQGEVNFRNIHERLDEYADGTFDDNFSNFNQIKTDLSGIKNLVDNAVMSVALTDLMPFADSNLNVDCLNDATVVGQQINDILFNTDYGLCSDEKIRPRKRQPNEKPAPLPKMYFNDARTSYTAVHARVGANVGRIMTSIGLAGIIPHHRLMPISFMPKEHICEGEADNSYSFANGAFEVNNHFDDFEGRIIQIGQGQAEGNYIYATRQVIDNFIQQHPNDMDQYQVYVYDPMSCPDGGWCIKHQTLNRVANVIRKITNFSQEDLTLRLKKSLDSVNQLFQELNFDDHTNNIHWDRATLRANPDTGVVDALNELQAYQRNKACTLHQQFQDDGLTTLTYDDVLAYIKFCTPAFYCTLSSGESVMLSFGDVQRWLSEGQAEDGTNLARALQSDTLDLAFSVMSLTEICDHMENSITNNTSGLWDCYEACQERSIVDPDAAADAAMHAYTHWDNYGTNVDILNTMKRSGAVGATNSMALQSVANPTMAMSFDEQLSKMYTNMRKCRKPSLPGFKEFNDDGMPSELRQVQKHIYTNTQGKVETTLERERVSYDSHWKISDILADDDFSFYTDPYDERQDAFAAAANTTDGAGHRKNRLISPDVGANDYNEMYVIATNDSEKIENLLSDARSDLFGHDFVAIPTSVRGDISLLSQRAISPYTTNMAIGDQLFDVYAINRIWDSRFSSNETYRSDIKSFPSQSVAMYIYDNSKYTSPDSSFGFSPGFFNGHEAYREVGTASFSLKPLLNNVHGYVGHWHLMSREDLANHLQDYNNFTNDTGENNREWYLSNMFARPDNVGTDQITTPELLKQWRSFLESASDPNQVNELGIISQNQLVQNNQIIGGAAYIDDATGDYIVMPLIFHASTDETAQDHTFYGSDFNINTDGRGNLLINKQANYQLGTGFTCKLYSHVGKGMGCCLSQEQCAQPYQSLLNIGDKRFDRIVYAPQTTVLDRSCGQTQQVAETSMDALARLIPSSLRYNNLENDGAIELDPNINKDFFGIQDNDPEKLLINQMFVDKYGNQEGWRMIANGTPFYVNNQNSWTDADRVYYEGLNRAIRCITINCLRQGISLGLLFEPHTGIPPVVVADDGTAQADPNYTTNDFHQIQGGIAVLSSVMNGTRFKDVVNLYNKMNSRIVNRWDETPRGEMNPKTGGITYDAKTAAYMNIALDENNSPYVQVLVEDPDTNETVYVQGAYAYETFDMHQSHLGSPQNQWTITAQHTWNSLMDNGLQDNDLGIDAIFTMFENQGISAGGVDYTSADRDGYDPDRIPWTDQLLNGDNRQYSPYISSMSNNLGMGDFAARNRYFDELDKQADTFSTIYNIAFFSQDGEIDDIIKEQKYKEIKQRLKEALDFEGPLSDSLVMNIFKRAYGFTAREKSDTTFKVNLTHFTTVMNRVIQNINDTGKGTYMISGGRVEGIDTGVESTRYSFPLAQKGEMETLYHYSKTLRNYYDNGRGGYQGFVQAGLAQHRNSQDAVVHEIYYSMQPSKFKQRAKRDTYLLMGDYLLSQNGLSRESKHIWAGITIDDIRHIDADMKGMFYTDKQKEEARLNVEQRNAAIEYNQRMAQRNAGKFTTQQNIDQVEDSVRPDYNVQITKEDRPAQFKTLRNITTVLKLNLLAEPFMAVANVSEGFVRSGLMRAGLGITNRNRKEVCSDRVTHLASQNPELRKLFEPLAEAHILGKEEELIMGFSQHAADGTLDEFIQSIYRDQNKFERFADKAFRKVSCDKMYLGKKLDYTLKFFASLCDRYDNGQGLIEQVTTIADPTGNGQTAMEMALQDDPVKWLTDVLAADSPSRLLFLQAMNMAEKVTMTQENIISVAFDYAFEHTRFGGAAKFLTSGIFTPFYRYKLNQMGKLAGCIIPVSTIHYLAVDLASKTNLGQDMGIERAQLHARLFDAIVTDAMHMTIPMLAFVLANVLIGASHIMQPPEDRTKEWDYREWTLFGERIGEVWWIQDILGMALPIAAYTCSLMNGEPNMAILMKGMEIQVSINPMINPFDIFDMFASDDIEEDYNLTNYVNTSGNTPTVWDLVSSGITTTALSLLGRYITPMLLREYSQSYNYEKSYKKVFTKEALEEGPINAEAGERGYTEAVDYGEAQIRKVTRNNVLLASIFDLLNPESTTSYGATGTLFNSQGMPNTEYYDPRYNYYRDRYSIYDEETGEQKSDKECEQVALDIITTFEQYDNMDDLYENGFTLDYDTRCYVSKFLTQLMREENTQFYDWLNSPDGDAYTLGNGDYETGAAIRQGYYDEHNDLQNHWKDLYYDKLWSDQMKQGAPVYFSENTPYRQSSTGELYASGDIKGLRASINLPFYGLDQENNLGAAGDYESVGTNGESLGRRALVAYTPDLESTPSIDDWLEDDEDTSSNDEESSNSGTKNKSGYGSGYGYSKRSSSGYSRRSSGYSRSGYSRSGYSRSGYSRSSSNPSMPNIYSRVYVPSEDRPTTMNTSKRTNANYDYLKPNWETKGSREASKRSDF